MKLTDPMKQKVRKRKMKLTDPMKQKVMGMVAEALNSIDIQSDVKYFPPKSGIRSLAEISREGYFVKAEAASAEVYVEMTIHLSPYALMQLGLKNKDYPEVNKNGNHSSSAWLKENAVDDSIRRALDEGWVPPSTDRAIDWWLERTSSNPDEYTGSELKEFVGDLLRDLPEDKLMERLLSYYSVEADNFLENHKQGEVEAMKWLEERNDENEFLNSHFLRVNGKKPGDCGREIVRMLYTEGAKRVSAFPIEAPGIWGKMECVNELFVEFPDDWKLRMALWVYITNLHPKVVELESEGPVAAKVTF